MKNFLKIPLALLSLSAFCCGPYFPSSFIDDEGRCFKTESSIHNELSLICEHYFPEIKKYSFKRSDLTNLQAEIQDFTEASGRKGRKLSTLLTQLQKDRELVERGLQTQHIYTYSWAVEFKLYLNGVAEIKNDPTVLKPKAWMKLLQLPKSVRQFKTASVLYMLGNLHMKDHYAEGIKFYQQLRDEVNSGVKDTEGLAFASFKSEYQYTCNFKTKVKASVKCFYAYSLLCEKSCDDYIVYKDFLYLLRNTDIKNVDLWEGSEDDALFFDIIFLYYSPFKPENSVLLAKLTEVPKKAMVNIAPRLAWQAFESGDIELSKKYMDYCPDDSIIKLWLQAKLARRDRDYEKSAELLRKWLKLYSGRLASQPICFSTYNHYRTFSEQVEGSLGKVLVYQSDFVEALYTFLKIESSVDCYHLAERFLTTDQLVLFCDQYCSEAEGGIQLNLRHLLARRLLREQRYDEVLKYMPELNLKRDVAKYIHFLQIGNNELLDADTRAVALYNAGKYLLYNGAQMMGAQLTPDYVVWDGSFDYAGMNEHWFDKLGHQGLEFRKVFELREMTPNKRYHYRYVGVDLMGKAAKITTDVNVKLAALYLAGNTLKFRDPKAADVLYKGICANRPHLFAELTTQRRWFLKEEEVPTGLRHEISSTKPLAKKDFAGLFSQIED